MTTERRFEITLETLEPFRIGGKGDPLTAAENPVAIVGSQAVIPGSSLKGALRSQIEQYLVQQYYDQRGRRWEPDKAAAQPCMAGTSLSADEQRLVREGKYRGDACVYPARRDRNTALCPACYVLGAQGLTGFVRVPFLTSTVSPDELYSARIDRATDVVAHSTNRPYQLIPQGTTFKGTLHLLTENDILGWSLGKPRPLTDGNGGDRWLRDDPSWTRERILKELLIDRLQAINILGGYKSKGFGRVKITVTPLE